MTSFKMKIGFKFSVNSMAGLTLLCLLQGTSFAKESGASEVLDDIVAYFGVVPSEIIGTHNPNHTEATFMAGYPRTSVLTSWSLLCL